MSIGTIFPKHNKGLTAAKQAYILAVRKGLGPSDAVESIVDAYTRAQSSWSKGEKRSSRRLPMQIFSDLPEGARKLCSDASQMTGVSIETICWGEMPIGYRLRAAAARRMIWGALRKAGMSYPAISRLFDCDYTSIMYSLRKSGVGTPKNHVPERMELVITKEDEERYGLKPLEDVPFCGAPQAEARQRTYERQRSAHRMAHPMVSREKIAG